MRNIKLILEYDGTEFHGFQRQRELRTVQGVLEKCFSQRLGEPIRVIGAGRTDAGVHAEGQVVNFRTTRPVPEARVAEVLNAALPRDVKIQSCEEVAEGFHARRCARSRRYRYTVMVRKTPSPLLGRHALIVSDRPAVRRMARAARMLVGRRDFAAFRASGSESRTTERRLLGAECRRQGDAIWITTEADSYLYRMVRNMASALLAVGRGEMAVEELMRAVAEGDRRSLPPPAPPCGLCLMRVSY